MKDLNNFISERLHINKDSYFPKEYIKDVQKNDIGYLLITRLDKDTSRTIQVEVYEVRDKEFYIKGNKEERSKRYDISSNRFERGYDYDNKTRIICDCYQFPLNPVINVLFFTLDEKLLEQINDEFLKKLRENVSLMDKNNWRKKSLPELKEEIKKYMKDNNIG